MKITRMRTDTPIRVRIGPNVTVYIHKIGERAKLAVDAPPDLQIEIDTDVSIHAPAKGATGA